MVSTLDDLAPSAVAPVPAELSRGRALVRLLDALVSPWLEENEPDRVAEWQTLTRFVRVAPVVETPVPTPAPTPIATTPEVHAA
jgi:hypothetical protein